MTESATSSSERLVPPGDRPESRGSRTASCGDRYVGDRASLIGPTGDESDGLRPWFDDSDSGEAADDDMCDSGEDTSSKNVGRDG